jgi:predicted O-linked N-acetylglucosamine transferase (SPINDLY family)
MDELFQFALDLHKAGRVDEAAGRYAAFLALNPRHAHAHYLYGCIFLEKGDFAKALPHLERAKTLVPSKASYHTAIGTLGMRQADFALAAAAFRDATRCADAKADAFEGLGHALLRGGNPAESTKVFRKAIQRFGTTSGFVGGLTEAAVAARDAESLSWLVSLLRKIGGSLGPVADQIEYRACLCSKNPMAAFESAKKWLERAPDSIPALLACADALLKADLPEKCLEYVSRVLEREPENRDAVTVAFGAYYKLKAFAIAARFGRIAVRNHPGDRANLCNLAYALYKSSERADQDNVELAYHFVNLIPNIEKEKPTASVLSSVLLNMLRIREGMDWYDKTLALDPDCLSTGSGRAFHYNYTWYRSREDIFRMHEEWGGVVRRKVGPAKTDFANDPDPEKRLRIGFVSADFVNHPVSFFFFPLFKDLLKDHEICIYSAREPSEEDNMSSAYKERATLFRNIMGLSDTELQATVVADGVDVLFDLSGHTTGHRLTAFARRMAPVQVSWLAYPNTTGLDSMDYRISDEIVEPSGDADRFSTEKIVRLPGGFHLYRPTYRIPDSVAPLPALKNGFITFGSFNNLKKAGMETYAAWAGILKAVPGSHLAIKDRNLDAHYNVERVKSILASYGVDPRRVTIKGMLKNNFDHLSGYNIIDIALDCFPYNGTTTTCEALLMGCPVVTVLGDTHVSRVSASILTHISHPEWIAADANEYVKKAVELSSDLEKLSAIRSNLREEMYRSPLCDTSRMVREMTEAIRTMWRNWCARRPATIPQEV